MHIMQGNQVLKFSANDLSYISTCATMKIGEDCPEGISFSRGCMYIARWVAFSHCPKVCLIPSKFICPLPAMVDTQYDMSIWRIFAVCLLPCISSAT